MSAISAKLIKIFFSRPVIKLVPFISLGILFTVAMTSVCTPIAAVSSFKAVDVSKCKYEPSDRNVMGRDRLGCV